MSLDLHLDTLNEDIDNIKSILQKLNFIGDNIKAITNYDISYLVNLSKKSHLIESIIYDCKKLKYELIFEYNQIENYIEEEYYIKNNKKYF
jgi:hypothetical protein